MLTVQKHFLVLVVCGLWLAACGTDTPEIIVPAAPTGNETVTTGGPEQQPTATTTVGSTSVPDGDTEPEETTTTTTTTGETPGGTPDTTSTTAGTVEPDVTTTTVAVEIDTSQEDVDLPEGVFVSDGAPTWASLNPSTAEDLVGWSYREETWGYEGGGIDVTVDGWSVTPTESNGGVPTLDVGLSITLLGNYRVEAGQPVLSLFPVQAQQSGQAPVIAWAFFPDRPGGPVTHSGPIDSAIWAPVLPGEERTVSFKWVVPGDTVRVDATIGNNITYSVHTGQEGQWGTVTPPTGSTVTAETAVLFPSCFSPDECTSFRMRRL